MLADKTFVRFATCQLTPAKLCQPKMSTRNRTKKQRRSKTKCMYKKKNNARLTDQRTHYRKYKTPICIRQSQQQITPMTVVIIIKKKKIIYTHEKKNWAVWGLSKRKTDISGRRTVMIQRKTEHGWCTCKMKNNETIKSWIT